MCCNALGVCVWQVKELSEKAKVERKEMEERHTLVQQKVRPVWLFPAALPSQSVTGCVPPLSLSPSLTCCFSQAFCCCCNFSLSVSNTVCSTSLFVSLSDLLLLSDFLLLLELFPLSQ